MTTTDHEPTYTATSVDGKTLAARLTASSGDDASNVTSKALTVACAALWGINGERRWQEAVAYAETPESGDIHRLAVAHTKRQARAVIAALRDSGILTEIAE